MTRDLYNFISPRHISDSGPVFKFITYDLDSDPHPHPTGSVVMPLSAASIFYVSPANPKLRHRIKHDKVKTLIFMFSHILPVTFYFSSSNVGHLFVFIGDFTKPEGPRLALTAALMTVIYLTKHLLCRLFKEWSSERWWRGFRALTASPRCKRIPAPRLHTPGSSSGRWGRPLLSPAALPDILI